MVSDLMMWTPGTRVVLKHSRDRGVIRAILDDEMVEVRLDADHDTIPVHLEDLTPESEAELDAPTLSDMPVAARIPESEIGETGLSLTFVSTVEQGRYQVFIINDSHERWALEVEWQQKGKAAQKIRGQITEGEQMALPDFYLDQLNDSPNISIRCWHKRAHGSGAQQEQTIRLRPKSFFQRQTSLPSLGVEAHHFPLDFKADYTASTNKLIEYTRNIRPNAEPEVLRRLVHRHDILELAEFKPEIDLHIEALRSDYENIAPNDIMSVQLRAFEQFVDKALRIGASRIFVIHGLGSGKLRKAIADRLREMDHIADFNNDYHPKYGYGATEVIFS